MVNAYYRTEEHLPIAQRVLNTSAFAIGVQFDHMDLSPIEIEEVFTEEDLEVEVIGDIFWGEDSAGPTPVDTSDSMCVICDGRISPTTGTCVCQYNIPYSALNHIKKLDGEGTYIYKIECLNCEKSFTDQCTPLLSALMTFKPNHWSKSEIRDIIGQGVSSQILGRCDLYVPRSVDPPTVTKTTTEVAEVFVDIDGTLMPVENLDEDEAPQIEIWQD